MIALLLGFFVIMNLFVSIILEALAEFEEEMEEAEEQEEAAEEAEAGGAAQPLPPPVQRGVTSAGGEVEGTDDDNDDDDEELHPLRAFSRSVVKRPETEFGLVMLIGASSIALAIDTPTLDPDSDLGVGLVVANYVFTLIFTLEACLRFLAYDPVRRTIDPLMLSTRSSVLPIVHAITPSHRPMLFTLIMVNAPQLDRKRGYLTSPFNLLDLGIVVISIVSLCPEMTKFAFLRLMRVARPLRLLGKVPGMQIIFTFLAKASGDVLNVVGVVLFCHMLFAVVGMELFLDGFGQCTDESIFTRSLCHPENMPPPPPSQLIMKPGGLASRPGRMMQPTALAGRFLKGGGGGDDGDEDLPVAWINPNFGSFDNFPSSVLLLFIAATGDGWDEHMFAGMDSKGPGVAKERNDASPMALFFILWLVLGSFTMMNLFVGSVVDNFTKVKAEEDGSALLTQEQRQWVRTMQEASIHKEKLAPTVLPPAPPAGGARRAFFVLVNSNTFDLVMTFVILANVLMMAVEYHGIKDDAMNYAIYSGAMQLFTDIYYVECTLKLVGLGWSGYFSSTWNRFDFFLVCVSLLDQFAAELLVKLLPVPPMLLRVIRVARIMRILRLLKRYKRLRDLVKTTVLSFPSFLNVGSLLGLVTFVYAVLGVQLFYALGPGDELNEQRNFASFGSASLLLIQCLTGDGWSTLMMDSMAGPERGCNPDAIPTDCGSSSALPYFLTYMGIGNFVLLNLIVAVILDNFSALGDVNPDLISAADIADFGELWAQSWHDKQAWAKPRKPLTTCQGSSQSPGSSTGSGGGAAGVLMTSSPCCPKAPYTPSARPKKRLPRMMEIDEPSLAKLLLLQPPPLGLAGKTDEHGAQHVVSTLSLSWDDSFAQFQDVVNALVRRSFEAHLDEFGDGSAVPAPKLQKEAVDETLTPSLQASAEPTGQQSQLSIRGDIEVRRPRRAGSESASEAETRLPPPAPLPPPDNKPSSTMPLPPADLILPPSTPSPPPQPQARIEPREQRAVPSAQIAPASLAPTSYPGPLRVPSSPAARAMAQEIVASKLSGEPRQPRPHGSQAVMGGRPGPTCRQADLPSAQQSTLARPTTASLLPHEYAETPHAPLLPGQPSTTGAEPARGPRRVAVQPRVVITPRSVADNGSDAVRPPLAGKSVPRTDGYRSNALAPERISTGTTRTGARRPEARPAEAHPDVAGVEPSEGSCRSTMHVRRPEQLPGKDHGHGDVRQDL